jgi:hypothetical protein
MQEDGLKQLRITKIKGDTYKLQYAGLTINNNGGKDLLGRKINGKADVGAFENE